MDNYKDWTNGRFKAFCCIGAMVAFVGFMLLLVYMAQEYRGICEPPFYDGR